MSTDDPEKPKGTRPSTYYIGQEFIDDTEHVKIRIICSFSMYAKINDFNFSTNTIIVHIYQQGSCLYLDIERSISKKLRDSIFSSDRSRNFFMAYIKQGLIGLNEYLTEQMYLTGHILIQTYSIYDIQKIEVIDVSSDTRTQIEWPVAIGHFPPTKALAKECDKRFIRDFIDAMNCLLRGNYDECIRKIISSLENSFSEYRVNGQKIPYTKIQNASKRGIFLLAKCFNLKIDIKQGSFKDKLNEFFNTPFRRQYWNNYIPHLKSNIEFIYFLRNKIMHENLRLKSEDNWICFKGIITISYLYQSPLIESRTRKYIFTLIMQFQAIADAYSIFDLDKSNFGKASVSEKTHSDHEKISIQLDDSIFQGLEIKKSVQKQIKKKYGI